MSEPARFFYPSQYYGHWAGEFWEILDALEDHNERLDRGVDTNTLALVAALFIVTNKLDDLVAEQ